MSYENVWRISFAMGAAGAYLQTQTGSGWWLGLTITGVLVCVLNRFCPQLFRSGGE